VFAAAAKELSTQAPPRGFKIVTINPLTHGAFIKLNSLDAQVFTNNDDPNLVTQVVIGFRGGPARAKTAAVRA
jgi:hypothetical protein